MSEPTILTSREFPPMLTAALSELGDVDVAGENAAAELLQSGTIYLAAGVDPVPATLISQFGPNMGLIANLAVGIDNIDLEAAGARGIRVSNTPVVTEDTADLTLALLLAACRRLNTCEGHLRAGDWAKGAGVLGSRVHGKTLGIIGFGSIGQAVAKRAAGFDLEILYHGPNPKPQAADLGARYRQDLSELLAESDIVSLNCPLSPATHHLLDAQGLAQMKPGAILVNTGRGALVDEAALVDALASGHLGGAGLDVFEFEPQVTPALKELDNVTLLPHIGSATGECRMDMALRALGNIRAYLESGEPVDACNTIVS